jgi:hypothetical protein
MNRRLQLTIAIIVIGLAGVTACIIVSRSGREASVKASREGGSHRITDAPMPLPPPDAAP